MGFFSRKKKQPKSEDGYTDPNFQGEVQTNGRKHKKKHKSSKKRQHNEINAKQGGHKKKNSKHRSKNRRRQAYTSDQAQQTNEPYYQQQNNPYQQQYCDNQQRQMNRYDQQQQSYSNYFAGRQNQIPQYAPNQAIPQPQRIVSTESMNLKSSAAVLQQFTAPPAKISTASQATNGTVELDFQTTVLESYSVMNERLRQKTLISCIAGLAVFIGEMTKNAEVKTAKRLSAEKKGYVTSETIEDVPSKIFSKEKPLKTAEPLEEDTSKSADIKTAVHLDQYVFDKKSEKRLSKKKHKLSRSDSKPRKELYKMPVLEDRDKQLVAVKSNCTDVDKPKVRSRYFVSEQNLPIHLNSDQMQTCPLCTLCTNHDQAIVFNAFEPRKKAEHVQTNRLPIDDENGLNLGWYKKISTMTDTEIRFVR